MFTWWWTLARSFTKRLTAVREESIEQTQCILALMLNLYNFYLVPEPAERTLVTVWSELC